MMIAGELMQSGEPIQRNGRREFLRMLGTGVLGLTAGGTAMAADNPAPKPLR